MPERVFKVILVGDSSVGKTSFMRRFCHDQFTDSFCSTIGVDFHTKLLMINKRVIALNIWDTVITYIIIIIIIINS